MSTKSWYVLNTKAVPQRYGLSKNIQVLFQSYDHYKMGSIDAAELGRLVRTSPNRRAALAATITKCATILRKDKDEVKTCVDIIEMCTEILEITDRGPSTGTFPFMKLPEEIRDRIFKMMISTTFRTDGIVPLQRRSDCKCPWADQPLYGHYQSPTMKSLPAALGTALKGEFFRIFFRQKAVRFRCTCELGWYLAHNDTFFNNISNIKVHWCGTESNNVFNTLATCPRLEKLTLIISKITLTYINERASMMHPYFPLSARNTRLTDILGLDELLELRGLKEVSVAHAQPRGTGHAFEIERANLAALLSSRLTREKEL